MPKAKSLSWLKAKFGTKVYSEYYKKCTVQDHIILYQSAIPTGLYGTAFAVLKEMIKNGNYQNFIHYVVISNKEMLNCLAKQSISDKANIIYIINGSKQYYTALASAKYILFDKSLPLYYIKKPEQICVHLCTRTPIRELGIQNPSLTGTDIWRTQRSLYFSDYIVTPNEATKKLLADKYQLEGLYEGKVIPTQDIASNVVRNTEKKDVISYLEQKTGIRFANRKILLYAPSLRTYHKKSIDNTKSIIAHMEKIQSELEEDYVILLRLSANDDYFLRRNKKWKSFSIRYEVSDEELLGITDVLLADYNDIFFPFLCTGKPILFFPYDNEKYEMEDRMTIPIKKLPGPVLKNIKEVMIKLKAIKDGTFQYTKTYEKFKKKYQGTYDGAIQNVIDVIFENKESIETTSLSKGKQTILLNIGGLNNINERELCFYILRKIDYENYVVAVDGTDIYSFEDKFAKINPSILIVNGRHEKNKTTQESEILKNIESIDNLEARELFEREYASVYGGISFDYIIDIVGKSGVWLNMISAIACKKKIMVINQKESTNDLLTAFGDYLDTVVVVENEQPIEKLPGRAEYITRKEFIKKCGMNPLNVLFISAFDSTNYVFVNLIKELTKRGHICTVVVKDKKDYINNKMYVQEEIPFVEISEFDMKLVNIVDFVFSAPLKYDCYNTLYRKLNQANKFIITFASLFSSVVMGVNPDLALCIGKSKFDEFRQNCLKYNAISIGNPQYDELIRIKKRNGKKDIYHIKKVLIIEQGAYPFGPKGKTQEADLFCHLARTNPDKEFVVKPRYLPKEKGKQLHVLSEHVYDYITDKPDNLILTDEPLVLEDIMPDFDAAITTWSTAYLDAAILGLPIMLIEGFDSIDVFNVRKQRVSAAYDRLRHSGCVVHFEELYKRPIEFKFVDEVYLDEEIYCPDEPCVPRIIEVLEFLYNKLIIQEKRWQHINEFEYKEFFENFDQIPLIDIRSSEYRHRNRIGSEVNKLLQKFVFENRCMAESMDITPVYKYWDCDITEETTKAEVNAMLKSLKEEMKAIKEEFFTEHFEDIICQDRIIQDYYFQWLFQNKKFEELLEYDNTLICPESLYFYRAVILFKKHKYKIGTKYMSQFFEISQNKVTKDLRKDMSISGFIWKGKVRKYVILYYLDKFGSYEVIERLDHENVIYQQDIMLYYRVKSFVKRGMSEEAKELLNQYSRTVLKKSQKKTLKIRIKQFIGKRFYNQAEKLLV